ncbi:hypothetical protein GF336_06950 [Candidatus Woesearchaeota archaeon]|nr:hypothetical protein [Candidatus Woesearchaeota archaeon]
MNKKIYIMITVAALVLSMVPLLRFINHDTILPGRESYHHLDLAASIQKSGLPEEYIFNPFHHLLAYLGKALSLSLSAIILPSVLGMLSLIILYALLSNLGFKEQQKNIITALTAISPAFIYMFTIINPHALSMVLLLLSFYIYTRDDAFSKTSALLLMTGTAFYSPINLLVIASFLIYINNGLRRLYSLAVAIPSIINHILIFRSMGFLNIPEPSFNIIFELGASIGYTTFALLLFIPGLYIVWKNKKQIKGYSLLLMMGTISFYFSDLNLFLNVIVIIIATYPIIALIKREWALETIKKATFFILLIGLLLPAAIQIKSLADSQPSKEVISSLEWLKDNSNKGSVIFSETENSFWIQTVAERDTVLDSNQLYQSNLEGIKEDINTIFYSRNLEKTTQLLRQYSIDYIYIDPEMKSNIWKEPGEGLLFLFRNKETFEKIYSKNSIEIWKITLS